jgi:Peptidase family S41
MPPLPPLHRTRSCHLIASVILLAVAASASAAEPHELGAASFWRAATETDVAAAYALIEENHPGALAEVGDKVFRRALEEGHAAAVARTPAVTTYEGYTATLAAFADALKDKHIWSRPTYVLARPEWAGILLSKRGDRWIVVDEEQNPGIESTKGAELTNCDGRSPDDWAHQTLGTFRVNWSIGAQQVQAAPWLLVDEHNPFVPRPQVCEFQKAAQHLQITLDWRPIKRELLMPRIASAGGAGAAGFGVRAAGEGYWIALQNLLEPAAAVVAEVAAKAEVLRNARFIVLDLRGNGGGSSIFGEQIARSLMGAAYVDPIIGTSDDDCDSIWRTSVGNIRQLQYYVEKMGPTRGPEFTAMATQQLNNAKAAHAAGRPLSGSLKCVKKAAAGGSVPNASKLKGRLVLITDNLCFSSCLIVAKDFRDLGALHVGQTTDADTHYSEVREELMPSGLSKFSTLQALSPAEPLQEGPYVPSVLYDGDIADTATLERWIVTLSSGP